MDNVYMTYTVNALIPAEVLNYCLCMVRNLEAQIKEPDYFMVFNISKYNDMLAVELTTERPEYYNVAYIMCNKKVEEKIYCIRDKEDDDKNMYTFLFPDEY